ncbi:MAG: rod shape-determining protein MreD [Alphaproteobacteria bacterium]|nr:rod shape-determining protein MreD [Alphaproteobacteria bacterium]
MAYRKSISTQEEKWYVITVKASLPFFCCAFLLLLGISQSFLTNFEGLTVFFLFIGIFYWAFNGHLYFHLGMALFFGLWLDLLIGQMIGVYSITFLICYLICNIIRDNFWNRSIFVSLAIFMAMLLIPFFIHIIITIMHGNHPNISQLILSMIFASLCYIPLHGIFTFLRYRLW